MKIDFEITKDGLTLKDSIVLPDDHSLSEQEIEQLKESRFDAFYLMATTSQEEEDA